MRYTTLIDISELTEVYRCVNARLIYLHLALKAGYHDEDRDRLTASIRTLAIQTGLTFSATRHAIKVLQDHGLLKREGGTWSVKKWQLETPPTPRPRQKQAAGVKAAGNIAAQQAEQIQEYQQKLMNAVRVMTTEELTQWAAELGEGRSLNHRGAYLRANRESIEWLHKVIKQKNG